MNQPTPTPDQIRAAVITMINGTALQTEERRLEIIITNPDNPEKGQVVVSLTDGYVIWERTETSYWGHLEGIPSQDHDTPAVPASQIIQALTDRM